MSKPNQRHISTYEQLPPDLKRIVDTQQPWLRVNEAAKFRKRSRARICEGLKEGRYFAVRDGSTTLINTLSLVLDMANLPAAKIAAPKQHEKKELPPPRDRNAGEAEAVNT